MFSYVYWQFKHDGDFTFRNEFRAAKAVKEILNLSIDSNAVGN